MFSNNLIYNLLLDGNYFFLKMIDNIKVSKEVRLSDKESTMLKVSKYLLFLYLIYE